MNTKRLATGSLVGGIALWAAGYLIFDLALGSFYAANLGSATGVLRDSRLMWADALGSLSLAVLLTLAVTWARASTIVGGFQIGATVGFLVWFGVDFLRYGGSNVWNLTLAIVDPLVEIIRNGIVGAVIVAVIGRDAPSGSTGAGNP